MKKILAGVALALSLVACSVPVQGKLYNLKTGEITPVTYSYNGTGKGTLQYTGKGRTVRGDYLTVTDASTWGNLYGAYGGIVAGATQRGSAVAGDGQGFVLQCEYTTDVLTGGGAGYCRDNQGADYRMTF